MTSPDAIVAAGGFVLGFVLSGAHPVHHWRLRRKVRAMIRSGRDVHAMWCWRCFRWIDALDPHSTSGPKLLS